jgi:hypothetical protein
MFEDGEYMLRVRALDENNIVLDTQKEFKEERVQASWLDAKEKDPNLQMEQYRLEKHVAYCNESDVFTIDNTGETVETDGTVDKRSKVNSITQAIIHYRSAHLAKGEPLDIDDTGADLAVLAAMWSSYKEKPTAGGVFVGEVSLLGEVRKVKFWEKRKKEAEAMGKKLVEIKNVREIK